MLIPWRVSHVVFFSVACFLGGDIYIHTKTRLHTDEAGHPEIDG